MPHPGQKPHILCVDRDTLSQRLRRDILQNAGYTTAAVNSLQEADPYLKDDGLALAVIDEAAVRPDELHWLITEKPKLHVLLLMATPAVPPSAARMQYFSKLDGPEAFLRTVRECVKSD